MTVTEITWFVGQAAFTGLCLALMALVVSIIWNGRRKP